MEMRRRVVILFKRAWSLYLKKIKACLKDRILVSNLKMLKKLVEIHDSKGI